MLKESIASYIHTNGSLRGSPLSIDEAMFHDSCLHEDAAVFVAGTTLTLDPHVAFSGDEVLPVTTRVIMSGTTPADNHTLRAPMYRNPFHLSLGLAVLSSVHETILQRDRYVPGQTSFTPESIQPRIIAISLPEFRQAFAGQFYENWRTHADSPAQFIVNASADPLVSIPDDAQMVFTDISFENIPLDVMDEIDDRIYALLEIEKDMAVGETVNATFDYFSNHSHWKRIYLGYTPDPDVNVNGRVLFFDEYNGLPPDDVTYYCDVVRTMRDMIAYIMLNGCPSRIVFNHDVSDGASAISFIRWLIDQDAVSDGNIIPKDFELIFNQEHTNAKASMVPILTAWFKKKRELFR